MRHDFLYTAQHRDDKVFKAHDSLLRGQESRDQKSPYLRELCLSTKNGIKLHTASILRSFMTSSTLRPFDSSTSATGVYASLDELVQLQYKAKGFSFLPRTYMLKNSRLSADELAELRSTLDKYKKPKRKTR